MASITDGCGTIRRWCYPIQGIGYLLVIVMPDGRVGTQLFRTLS